MKSPTFLLKDKTRENQSIQIVFKSTFRHFLPTVKAIYIFTIFRIAGFREKLCVTSIDLSQSNRYTGVNKKEKETLHGKKKQNLF